MAGGDCGGDRGGDCKVLESPEISCPVETTAEAPEVRKEEEEKEREGKDDLIPNPSVPEKVFLEGVVGVDRDAVLVVAVLEGEPLGEVASMPRPVAGAESGGTPRVGNMTICRAGKQAMRT